MIKSEKFIKRLKMVSNLDSLTGLQEHFSAIAKEMFGRIAIKAGDKYFKLIEVEFYYFKQGTFEGPLFNCTYPRTRDAGQLFWHYSGIDICFDSKEDDLTFGGILIRSIMNEDGKIIAGPMRCSDELMNCCKQDLPIIVDYETGFHEEPKTTFRYGIKADKDKEKNPEGIKLRYYLPQDSWTRKREQVLVADEKTGSYKKENKRDYYTALPKKRK